jgi:putative peptidoglycan lipid II flippase
VTGPPASVTEPGPLRQVSRGIGWAAALIGGITVIARVVGFGRQLVFAHTVGSHCLGTAYATANQVPNIIYDIVLGGALTSAVVPVLAGAAARRAPYRTARPEDGPPGRSSGPDEPASHNGLAGRAEDASGTGRLAGADELAGAGGRADLTGGLASAGGPAEGTGGTAGNADRSARRRPEGLAPAARTLSANTEAAAGPETEASPDAEASQIASALLTWTVVLLAPASLIIALIARPVASALLGGVPHCSQAAAVTVSSGMLVVFAPQVLLYGLAVVLYGILQAHRRFTAPALAPVVSSLVVIAAYLAFVPLSAGHDRLAGLPRSAELVLSLGTTAGVAALVLIALGPALRLRLRLRPALRFPAGVARRVRGLAAVGFGTLIAQDASLVAVMVLANSRQGRGAVVLYNYGWQMFFVPYAVLAVPIATSVFPELSASDGPAFDRTAAASTRAAMLVSWLGAALLAGVAWPAAHLFVSNVSQTRQLALAFTAFAPGLVGYGLAAGLSRVLFASGRNRLAAVALIGGWLVVTAVDVTVVPLVRARWVVPVLGLGNTIGLTCAGIALLLAVRASRGPAALRGSGRAAAAGLAGAVAGAGAGVLVSAMLRVSGFFPNACVTLLACASAAAVFAVAVLALDGGDLRAVAGRTVGRWFR